MAKLILGPVLRRVSRDQALVWFQTDRPSTIRVTAGQVGGEAATQEFEGIHLAWVVLRGLRAGSTPYEVELDGERVWPEPGAPPSVITTGAGPSPVVAFGSCREPLDHGTDALVAYARRALAGAPLPDALALIGDQIYADSLSPAMLDWLAHQDRPVGSPPDQVVTFGEYARLYLEAWSEPSIRWLLSTVPTYMIFDDHEIMDDWNSSATWLADMQTRPWWSERIRAGLTTYYLFQHLGNLAPEEIDPQRLPRRWSFSVDIGRTRLIMLDCRGSRVLDGPVRRMFPQEDWDWLAQKANAACDHLILACSLPWLLAPVIHHGEAAMEVLSHRLGGAMERLRRRYDLEHWSAVGHSFDELTDLIASVDEPATISVIGGDVHHSYVASAVVDGGRHVLQVTCSPLNNGVSWVMRTLLRVGWFGARLFGRDSAGVRWRPLTRPYFGNAIATLTYHETSVEVLLEGAENSALTPIYPSNVARM